jgi:hypothetical protein
LFIAQHYWIQFSLAEQVEDLRVDHESAASSSGVKLQPSPQCGIADTSAEYILQFVVQQLGSGLQQ